MVATLRKAFWIFGVSAFLLIAFLPGYTKVQELRTKNTDLKGNIRKLIVENYLLEEELKRLETDPVYQERIAREKMGVVRKGEIPLKIIPERRQ